MSHKLRKLSTRKQLPKGTHRQYTPVPPSKRRGFDVNETDGPTVGWMRDEPTQDPPRQ